MERTHKLKTESLYFLAVISGVKKFEIRKNDRDFKIYDTIILEETESGIKTGCKSKPLVIKYIFQGGKFGLSDEYCIINW